MAIFFSSDFHLNHFNIIRYCGRPYTSTEEMDTAITKNTNDIVGENDTLYFLGDFCFGPKYDKDYIETVARYRNELACRDIRFCFGNHDRRYLRDAYRSLFSSTKDMDEVKSSGYKFVLCHYALATWERSGHGSIMLYGHSHSSAEVWLDKAMPGRRSMDVGIDNAAKILGKYRPFRLEEIISIMAKRPGFSIDHHA